VQHGAAARTADGRRLRAGDPQDLPEQLIPFDDLLPRRRSIARSAGRWSGRNASWSRPTQARQNDHQRQESEADASIRRGRADPKRGALDPPHVWGSDVVEDSVPRLPSCEAHRLAPFAYAAPHCMRDFSLLHRAIHSGSA
jgi:hypothetical protein